MSSGKEKDPVQNAIDQCSMTQCVIDNMAKQLEGLRTQCSTTEEITQKEIKEAEGKLIHLVARQLVAKAKLKTDKLPKDLQAYPLTEQWLQIVGIPPHTVKGLIGRGMTLDSLLETGNLELRRLLEKYGCDADGMTRLTVALRNLKNHKDRQLRDDKTPLSELELHWTSFNKSTTSSPYGGSSPKFSHSQRPSTSSLPPEACLNTMPQSPQSSPASPPTPPHSTPSSPLPPYPSPAEQRRRYTPPPTPPLVKATGRSGKFPTTPPPQKRNKLYPDVFHPLTKSKSHESQLYMRVNVDGAEIAKHLKKKPGNLKLAGSSEAICNRRQSTEGSEAGGSSRGPSGQTSPLILSPKHSSPYKHMDQVSLPDDMHPGRKNRLEVALTSPKPSLGSCSLQENLLFVPPISPKTPLGSRSMLHSIRHRFANTFKITNCDYCQKQMFIGYKCKECKLQTKFSVGPCDICHKSVLIGKVCKDCKLKFHRDCAEKAAPACGLPNEYVDFFVDFLRDANENAVMRPANSVPAFQVPDSSSNTSSCNSSTPSSPALFIPSCQTPPSSAPSPQIQITPDTQFQFPEISSVGTADSIGSASTIAIDITSCGDNSDVVNTNTSNDSDKSDKTVVDGPGGDRSALLDRGDSTEIGEDGQTWTRVNSISITLKEWDIPYEDLVRAEKLGTGRFGTVYKGNWHGDVAIKMLNMDPDTDNQSQLQAFKLEVAMLRKTRHENLVLFMGACMKPPHLAIVTSLCKGQTLYTHIHVRKEKFALNRSVLIASQIAQGMGYLHAKGIVHKDLKTKNIFVDSGKVVITDFGLFSVTKLCYGTRKLKGDFLSIPPGWLCYLSPEIMRSLRASNRLDMDLPFTEASDVYAFGTVWYELLCGVWPFKNQPPEAVIWQVGKGMKQSLSSVQASRDVKDVMMLCWSYKTDDRPDFSTLLRTLERLPKKRLARSPSHPVQLSRSAESVF